MYYSMENQQVASEPTLVSVADPNSMLINWKPIGQDDVIEARPMTVWRVIGMVGSTAGTIGGAYHGYKRARSNKILVALWYAFIGGIAWPVVIPIMYAQGFGKQKTG